MNYTKGEWTVAANHLESFEPFQYTILANGSNCVAEVWRHNYPEAKFREGDANKLNLCLEADANAKLIAAAPKLLESLQVLIALLDSEAENNPSIKKRINFFLVPARITVKEATE